MMKHAAVAACGSAAERRRELALIVRHVLRQRELLACRNANKAEATAPDEEPFAVGGPLRRQPSVEAACSEAMRVAAIRIHDPEVPVIAAQKGDTCSVRGKAACDTADIERR